MADPLRKIIQEQARLKGVQIECLENASSAVNRALEFLRRPDTHELSAQLSHELHTLHAGLGRLLSAQQCSRTLGQVKQWLKA
jgi:hypothetical protein